MPLPLITDTVRVAVRGTLPNGHRWVNVMHFRKTSVTSWASAKNIIQARVDAHYRTDVAGGISWKGGATTNASADDVTYTPLDGSTASETRALGFAGGNAGDALPGAVSLVTTLRTALRGRSYRGRVYQSPFYETYNVATGVPSAGLVAGVLAQWTAFVAAFGGTGVSLVVASYLHSTAQDVTTVSVDNQWDNQRRRNRP